MSEEKSVKVSPFSVGNIVICIPRQAGATKNPRFGKISNITSNGRYRILFLETIYPHCDRNTSDTSGSKTLIVPGEPLSNILPPRQKSLLAQWNSEHPNMLYSNGKHHHGYYGWNLYNPDQEYWARHDNGD